MLALQFQDSWGLAADGAFHAAVTETVATRLARIRSKLVTVGIPTALIGGGVTTLIFAGAFGLARSERVWAPALWLGGVSAVAGLISVAMAAQTVEKVAVEAAAAPLAPTPTAAETAVVAAQKAAYGYY